MSRLCTELKNRFGVPRRIFNVELKFRNLRLDSRGLELENQSSTCATFFVIFSHLSRTSTFRNSISHSFGVKIRGRISITTQTCSKSLLWPEILSNATKSKSASLETNIKSSFSSKDLCLKFHECAASRNTINPVLEPVTREPHLKLAAKNNNREPLKAEAQLATSISDDNNNTKS